MITIDNYHSDEVNKQYMSVSQYKQFRKCEAAAYAQYVLNDHKPKPTPSMHIGQILHSMNDNSMDKYVEKHPELISSTGKTKGELKATFKHALVMFNAINTDNLCKKIITGQTEKVFSAELFGVPWKIRLDVYNPEQGFFTDIKTCKSVRDKEWKTEMEFGEEYHVKVNFIEAWDYYTQFAVYAEIERRANERNNYLDAYMVAVSSEDTPDKECINMTNHVRWDDELKHVQMNLSRILEVKHKHAEPQRCDRCEYCRKTKVCKEIVYPEDI